MRQTWPGVAGGSPRRGRRKAARAATVHVALAAALLAALVLVALGGGDGIAATAPVSSAALAFVPELGLPAREVVAIGASPGEEPAEAWAYGTLGQVPPAGAPEQTAGYTLLEHDGGGPWHRVPLPTGPDGKPPATGGPFPSSLGALAGQTTPAGSVALLTGIGIVVRDPGGAPRLVPAPSGAELLGEGETLPPAPPPSGAPTPYAVYDAAGAKAGVLIAPYGDAPTPPQSGGLGPGILAYDGSRWWREPIEAGAEAVRPLAISCGPTATQPNADAGENCWLLASLGASGERLGLFRRSPAPPPEAGAEEEGSGKPAEPGDGLSWAPVSVTGPLLGSQGQGGPVLAPLTGNAQMLTATSQGVWVDFSATIGGGEPRSASQLVEPAGPAPGATATVAGSWCYPTGEGCEESLGAAFPAAYRSFAWPGTTATDPGRRIITGLAARAMLELEGGTFHWRAGAGGSVGAAGGGAAFASPELGFVADDSDPDQAPDGAGQSQMIAVTPTPPAAVVATEPVPFRRPLLAVAPNPTGNGEAFAVGAGGEFARFIPGSGWRQEEVGNVNTEAGTSNDGTEGDLHENIRGVAWPTAETAYAVGEAGGRWIWREQTGTWLPLSAATGSEPYYSVAFSPSDPSRGFMVGADNIDRLSQSGESWEPDPPAPGRAEGSAVWTSVAFAGNEALVAWHTIDPRTGAPDGGVSVEDGSGWKVETKVGELLADLPGPPRWPTKVAGLPDGGAVAAGPGFVLKRDSANAEWKFAAEPLPEAGDVAALAAFREGSTGELRAVVSVGLHERVETMPGGGSSVKAEPLPTSGYLLRETAGGWEDLEHQAFPVVTGSNALPLRPDPVLGLAVSSDGASVVGVGGQTGDFTGEAAPGAGSATPVESAAALRSPAAAAARPDQSTPIGDSPGETRPTGTILLVGGDARCEGSCADQQSTVPAPDANLRHALTMSSLFGGPGAASPAGFIYTGGRLGSTPTGTAPAEAEGYERELSRLAMIFGGAGTTPLVTTPSPDLTAGGAGLFAATFDGFGPTSPATEPYYSRLLPGIGGNPAVKVICLAFTASGELGATQEAWLREELAAAQGEGAVPIVVGSASLGSQFPETLPGGEPLKAKEPEQLLTILTEGGAAAYLFDYPGANMGAFALAGRQAGVLTLGTGTLGYSAPASLESPYRNDGAVLELTIGGGPGVLSLRLIPNIESLSLHDEDGPVLKAGKGELFEALARPPAGGVLLGGPEAGFTGVTPEPYLRMPSYSPGEVFSCKGPECPFAVGPSAYYTSSNPAVGDFYVLVEKRTRSAGGGNQEVRELEAFPSTFSPLFCPKEPGQTTVSVTTGGLTYSTPITVVPGEVGAECAPTGPQRAVPAPSRPPVPAGTPPPVSPSPHQPTGPSPNPAPVTHHPHPTPVPHGTPQPAPHQGSPTPSPSPPPAAPVPSSAPVVTPNPPPGAQPAPPTGVAPAAQPVAHPAAQSSPQASSQPAAQVGGAPVAVPYGARQEEHAQQRAHNAAALSPRSEPDILPFACLAAAILIAAAGVAVGSPQRARAHSLFGPHRR